MLTKLLTTTAPVGDLVARHMSAEYLDAQRPVFSSKTLHHVTFLVPSATLPGGQRLVCPGNCNAELKPSIKKRKDGSKKVATVTCTGCHRHVKVPLPKTGFAIEPGMKDQILAVPKRLMVQTPYPIPIVTHLTWRLRKPPKTAVEDPVSLVTGVGANPEVALSFPPTINLSLPPTINLSPPPTPSKAAVSDVIFLHIPRTLASPEAVGQHFPAESSTSPDFQTPLEPVDLFSRPSQQRLPLQSENDMAVDLPGPPIHGPRFADEEDGDSRTGEEGAAAGPSSKAMTRTASQQDTADLNMQTALAIETDRRIEVDIVQERLKRTMSNANIELARRRSAISLKI